MFFCIFALLNLNPKNAPEMDKISVNVSDSVYGRSCVAGNSLHTTSLQNGVQVLEGAQESKKGRNQGMIPTFFCALSRHNYRSVTMGTLAHTTLPKSPLYKGVAHSNDCHNDSVMPTKIPMWNHLHNTISSVPNRGAMFSSFVSNFVYGKKSPFVYTNSLVNIFNSINYNH